MSKGSARGNGRNARRGARNGDKQPAVSKNLLIGAGAAFAIIFGAFVAFTSNTPSAPPASAIGGPFQLISQTGEPVSETSLVGKPHLIFFGYTHCPDVCHTTLFEMSEILRALGPDAKAGALFVTIDPERDTQEVLKDCLANFDSRIIGVTGPRAQLDPMLRAYRIYAKRVSGKDDDYSVDHTSVVYLIDKNGHFVAPFNVGRKPEEAARELARYL